MNHRPSLKTLIASAMLTVGVVAPCSVCADDLDQQLLKSLQEEQDSESVVTIVNRLLDRTSQAGTRLGDSDFEAQTQALQQQILDDIDALLEKASPPPGSPPPPSDQTESQTQDGQPESAPSQPSAGELGDKELSEETPQSPQPHAASRESAERNSQADGSTSEQERRFGLATAVWGHLPPKIREQMRSAFSETYLPEYDDLVRQYYEALAARRHRPDRGDRESSSP